MSTKTFCMSPVPSLCIPDASANLQTPSAKAKAPQSGLVLQRLPQFAIFLKRLAIKWLYYVYFRIKINLTNLQGWRHVNFCYQVVVKAVLFDSLCGLVGRHLQANGTCKGNPNKLCQYSEIQTHGHWAGFICCIVFFVPDQWRFNALNDWHTFRVLQFIYSYVV